MIHEFKVRRTPDGTLLLPPALKKIVRGSFERRISKVASKLLNQRLMIGDRIAVNYEIELTGTISASGKTAVISYDDKAGKLKQTGSL